MFIKRHEMDCPLDKTIVRVTGSNPLYSIVKKSDAARVAPPEENEEVDDDEDWEVVAAVPEEEEEDLQGIGRDSQEGDDSWALPEVSSMSLGEVSVVAGVWTGSSGSEITMKVSKEGLKSLDPSDSLLPVTPPTPLEAITTISSVSTTVTNSTWKPVVMSSSAMLSKNTKGTKITDKSDLARKIRLGREEKQRMKAAGEKKPSKHAEAEQLDTLLISKHDLFKAVMDKMTPYFAVIAPNGSFSLHSGQLPKVQVIVELRMGKKCVTILRCLELFGLDLAALAKDCQKRFACSVSVSAVPGIPQDKEVIVQGNFGSETESLLVDKWGIPRHLVEVSAAKGAKIKKK